MVVVGGLGSIWGVVVGAIVLSVINNYFLPESCSEHARACRSICRRSRPASMASCW